MNYYREEDRETPQVNEPDFSQTYTARDYLTWTFEGLYELIRGKVFKMSPAPSSDHQQVSMNLIQSFTAGKITTGCKLFHVPFDVFLIKKGESWKDTRVVVEPDLCLICDETKIQERGCIGSPDFVVEILSKATAQKDQKDKFEIYQEYQIPEYWIVDPFNQSVKRNILQEGVYTVKRAAVKGEVIAPQNFPELKIEVDRIFEGVNK